MTTPIKLTSDLPANFFPKLVAMCKRLDCKPIDLLKVMASESGVRADARNPHGNATGLIQFMPATLKALRYQGSYLEFRHLTATQQLAYVEAYFTPWAKTGKPWNAARLYQATFLPATLTRGSGPDTVLAERGGYFGWAYEANTTFDRNGDKRITVGELAQAIDRNAKGPRWNEIVARLAEAEGEGSTAGEEADPTDGYAASVDLRSVTGLQNALRLLGFYTGKIDGIPGKLTRHAIASFQHSAKADPALVVDSIVGPKTLAALEAAVIAHTGAKVTPEDGAKVDREADTKPDTTEGEDDASEDGNA